MDIQSLKAQSRQATKSGAAGRLRYAGQIPGTVYGGGQEPFSIAFNTLEFARLMRLGHGEHAVLQLEVEDKPELSTAVLIKNVQHHPVREHVMHADFMRIDLTKRITTTISIVLEGQPKGVTLGGVMDQQLRDVEIECLAMEIPDVISMNVTAMEMGDSLHVRELQVPENVTILTDGDRTIATIHQPRVLKSTEEEAEATEGKTED
jgi:large subunit ribosomal protein L25